MVLQTIALPTELPRREPHFTRRLATRAQPQLRLPDHVAAWAAPGASKVRERWDSGRVMDRVEDAYALAAGAHIQADEAMA